MHESTIWVSIDPEIKYEAFGGALCWWGAWGPGHWAPLKSGPGNATTSLPSPFLSPAPPFPSVSLEVAP